MAKASHKQGKRGRTDRSLPLVLLLPALFVLLIVQFFPAFYTVWLSLQERYPTGWQFIGLENYRLLVNSSLFRESVGHTIVFLAGYVILTLSLGFIVASILNARLRLSGLYLALLFIPWTLADVLVGMVFRLLVYPDYGILSGILGNPQLFPPKGLSVLTAGRPTPWVGSFPFPPAPAMIYLILAASWRALPFITLLILASLQTISAEVIESARIDGATTWGIARYITIPLILPTLVVALFNLILTGVNSVGTVFSLTAGGPGTATFVLSYLLYNLGWGRLRFGQAAALAILMALVNWILIGGTMRVTRVDERTA
ncbi:MAG: carbohydrate ABC transporter permease [Anaerolineae bacterium]